MAAKIKSRHASRNGSTGMPVDAEGGPTVDPTKNVRDLVEAANLRQDDLRDEMVTRVLDQVSAIKEIASLRSVMLDQRATHLEQMANLRAEHSLQINEKETARVNAIRQVDVLAVSTAADNSSKAIQALAATTTQNADTLRAAVAATANTLATQLQGIVAPIVDRLGNLEKAQYQSQGRSTFTDPAQQALIDEVRKLTASRDSGSGKQEGISASWAVLGGGVALIVGLMAMYTFMNAARTPQPVIGVEPPVRVSPQ